ncbi:MAG: methylaspartate mutase subunit S [Clostridia bacterium]|nr:methylaspartate mutase subunit S [Oscillospiraceae bacterium]MBQ9733393.1 methylaspartate mutase subunit S [Clostridia bacterium]
MNYKVSVADFFTLAKGTLIDPIEEISYEEEAPNEYAEAIKKNPPTVITGTIGVDSHVIGTKLISRVLREQGFNVVAMGAQTSAEEFIKAAVETNADAMFVSSLYGMAEQDCQGFRDKCIEAGLDDIILSIGGILGVGKHDFADDEAKFKAIGFDHVYPPESPIEKSILDLCKDLEAKGRLVK